MSPSEPIPAALVYDDDAYVERLQKRTSAPPAGAMGLMGRQVAGKEFLNAYLTHGTWSELTALVRSRPRANTLLQFLRDHPSSRSRVRRVRVIEDSNFAAQFFPTPPARVIYAPCPPEERFAWARQHYGPGTFALCGVTHTLASLGAVDQLCKLLTAPFEPFDALICTSKAVVTMVQAVTGTYADYLRDRHGGQPALRPRLVTIPLGADLERFRPPTPEERALRRRLLHATDDEVVVLFVGRLSHHAKAHPFPMYHAVQQAVQETGRKVHLILAGWTAHPAVDQAFRNGAAIFAPQVRLSVVDGTQPEIRTAVWHAADLFVSLSDNIQETFGLVLIEAMASGIPVIASDWDGYRDLVVPGETGLLVPTLMVKGATASATAKLLLGEHNYDLFLAECAQATVVDPRAAGSAMTRLVADEALRTAMGAAGRRRVEQLFSWKQIIAAYENLWREQEVERQKSQGNRSPVPTPSRYPAPEISFAGYPTNWMNDNAMLCAASDAESRLTTLLNHPLTNFVGDRRITNEPQLRSLLRKAATPCSLLALDEEVSQAGVQSGIGRATVAWMLKYGLLILDSTR